MSKLHENIPVEAKVTEWLSKMGWALQTVDDLKPYNRLQMNAMIEPILVEKVIAHNAIKKSDTEVTVASSVQGNIFQGAIRNLRMFYPKNSAESFAIKDCLYYFNIEIVSKQKKVIVLERLKKSLMQISLRGKYK
jgi:hypothetical protein